MTKENQTELTEDMEVVGPGQMLKEARLALKLTQQDVALKLNFTIALVQNIESENFNNSLPSTYTRGYLKNYAKLVKVPYADVLASYELLGIAAEQQAEMQSFSQFTKKQAENSRLMWFSYLILAILIGLTVIWWQQEHQQEQDMKKTISAKTVVSNNTQENNTAPASNNEPDKKITSLQKSFQEQEKQQKVVNQTKSVEKIKSPIINPFVQKKSENTKSQAIESSIKTVTFTFSGDCWVNIYDATGERVAWGIKKADYVMNIKGKAPFSVTLGKPELVSINFNGQNIDMSQFGAGNIAKFTLPLKP
jgi:cytoskeleton protein RodZ